mmetsp:Transcript_57803/g.172538  ORF Transcript_57803/g.172538 Transcript_57803/m.172538 type:complete len:215 (-) Transcript_57803:802-1446(-)
MHFALQEGYLQRVWLRSVKTSLCRSSMILTLYHECRMITWRDSKTIPLKCLLGLIPARSSFFLCLGHQSMTSIWQSKMRSYFWKRKTYRPTTSFTRSFKGSGSSRERRKNAAVLSVFPCTQEERLYTWSKQGQLKNQHGVLSLRKACIRLSGQRRRTSTKFSCHQLRYKTTPPSWWRNIFRLFYFHSQRALVFTFPRKTNEAQQVDLTHLLILK